MLCGIYIPRVRVRLKTYRIESLNCKILLIQKLIQTPHSSDEATVVDTLKRLTRQSGFYQSDTDLIADALEDLIEKKLKPGPKGDKGSSKQLLSTNKDENQFLFRNAIPCSKFELSNYHTIIIIISINNNNCTFEQNHNPNDYLISSGK